MKDNNDKINLSITIIAKLGYVASFDTDMHWVEKKVPLI